MKIKICLKCALNKKTKMKTDESKCHINFPEIGAKLSYDFYSSDMCNIF